MNEIANRFFLTGDKFMPELHLKQAGFTYSACGPFTKSKEKVQKFMQTGDANYIYKNDRDKACFHHDMAYGRYKNLNKKTKYIMDIKEDSLQSFTIVLIKNLRVVVLNLCQINNLHMNFISQLLENLKDLKSILKDNIWGADLADCN